MDFIKFKAIMCDLEDLKYVKVREYDNHCFVSIIEQDNIETTNLISEKIIEIWENSKIIGGYRKAYGEFVFIETSEFTKCFEEENYEKIAKKIKELDPSFVQGFVNGHGIQKKIKLYSHNKYGNRNSRGNYRSFGKSIFEIIEENLPKDAHFYNKSVTTKKGKEWEEKKMNCAEIKVCEDFDKILSRY